MLRPFATILVITAASQLLACGQTGPLYLPELEAQEAPEDEPKKPEPPASGPVENTKES